MTAERTEWSGCCGTEVVSLEWRLIYIVCVPFDFNGNVAHFKHTLTSSTVTNKLHALRSWGDFTPLTARFEATRTAPQNFVSCEIRAVFTRYSCCNFLTWSWRTQFCDGRYITYKRLGSFPPPPEHKINWTIKSTPEDRTHGPFTQPYWHPVVKTGSHRRKKCRTDVFRIAGMMCREQNSTGKLQQTGAWRGSDYNAVRLVHSFPFPNSNGFPLRYRYAR
jgi:hypothetical protein